jgi:ferric-dicitrate binding protein FerR (iron transport regulator)
MQSINNDKQIREKINTLNEIPENIDWNVDKGWKQYRQKYRFSEKKKFLYWSTAAAAILLLVILLFVVPYNSGKTLQVSTQEGKTNITLKDGSKIWLNQHTKLTVNQKEGLIKLRGEIYAELSGESEYKISTPNGKFRSEYSHFNLNSREENKRAVVSVAKGSVVAFWDVKKRLKSTITKGIQAEIIPKVALVQAPIDDPNYLAWKTGQLKFNNTPLFSVIKKLEELNDINIHIQNKELRYCRMNSNFHSLSADTILRELPEYMDLQVIKKDNTYFLSGNGCNN